jgi:hypothetical protein
MFSIKHLLFYFLILRSFIAFSQNESCPIIGTWKVRLFNKVDTSSIESNLQEKAEGFEITFKANLTYYTTKKAGKKTVIVGKGKYYLDWENMNLIQDDNTLNIIKCTNNEFVLYISERKDMILFK